MVQPGSRNSAAVDGLPPLSRRNLPRASHACQWCRAKRAKCDQRQPCANCIKHSNPCWYGIRRRTAQNRNTSIQSRPREGIANGEDQIPSPASTRKGQDEPAASETSEQTYGSARSVFTHQTLPVHDSDVVGDINQHTHGTEFYGTSSNFVLLNQLFAYAQQHLPPEHGSPSNRDEISYLSPSSRGDTEKPSFPSENRSWTPGARLAGASLNAALPQGRVSIINILSNEEVLSPPSRPKTPSRITERQLSSSGSPSNTSNFPRDGRQVSSIQHSGSIPVSQNIQSRQENSNPSSHDVLVTNETSFSVNAVRVTERRLEREYVRLFMNNLHHLHPMLDSVAFTARCEDEIWAVHTPLERKKDLRHFFALYNIVVAVGALIAGSSVTQDFGRDIKVCLEQLTLPQNSRQPITSQALSRHYFHKSRALLGDVFEVCSLESAQTLLLMSLYCQNSLKPHACYMYCGQAVRTALAIGLPSESISSSAEDRKASRRTWWCIYSHEIDMSCSSGRRDSLGKPRNYQIPLVRIQDQHDSNPDKSEVENKSVAMVNEMVHFATVLRRISKELYHDSKGLTLLQKSVVAKELDTLLENWKARLPGWLDFGKVSFYEEEWAAKQKLVLHLRFLNAKILIHRPFLAATLSKTQLQMSKHVEQCLEAARETIRVLYDSYANRHYFRTWWYNSTYALYAGMIVLYVIMLGHTTVSSNDLLNDVIKSRDILQSMQEASVARRSADLICEALKAAQACVQYRQNPSSWPEGARLDQDDDGSLGQVDLTDMTLNNENDFSRTLFTYAGAGQDPGPLFASLIDSNLLQDFTARTNNLPGLDFSTSPFGVSYGEGADSDLTSIMQWQNGENIYHMYEAYQ